MLGRFLSPDSIVPGTGASLTTDFHEAWVRGAGRGAAAAALPQNLNRYTYARNNPIRYPDPGGHCTQEEPGCIDDGPSEYYGDPGTTTQLFQGLGDPNYHYPGRNTDSTNTNAEERAFAAEVRKAGYDVYARGQGTSTDFVINGQEWELKTLDANDENTAFYAARDAIRTNFAGRDDARVYIDARGDGLNFTRDQAYALIDRLQHTGFYDKAAGKGYASFLLAALEIRILYKNEHGQYEELVWISNRTEFGGGSGGNAAIRAPYNAATSLRMPQGMRVNVARR